MPCLFSAICNHGYPRLKNKSRRSTLRPTDLRYAGPAFGNVRHRNATAMERSCNESCVLRLIDRREVNSGTQFNAIAQEFENLGGYACNLYSITTNQAAIAVLFRVVTRYLGNLASMSSFFRPPTSAEADAALSPDFLRTELTETEPKFVVLLERIGRAFEVNPAPEGAFSAFCFGCGAVSVCSSMPALGLPGRLELGLPLTLRQRA